MTDFRQHELLADEFERHRSHLRAVAYRMLGSVSDADDAVQECWLRLSRSGADDIVNMSGWLTTVVARVALDMLRARRSRREDYIGTVLPEPIVSIPDSDPDPEQQALLADSVGLALLVVLDSLSPAERLAFVLHDMFALPFSEIASIAGTTPAAARQLASRARRRVRGAVPPVDSDLEQQREVIAAFLEASRNGSFQDLVAILHPDAVFRIDAGGRTELARAPVHGAEAVADQVLARGTPMARFARHAMVNGSAGVLVAPAGRLLAVLGFTIVERRIIAIDLIADPQKLARISPR
ncbi:MAG: sigma-70 family RNA polymerase sigma factor [Actinobacteria bacterium]|nr:MAG: sigma-70 family RNA polymerase sigma factor [Actinomycetota bacterium]